MICTECRATLPDNAKYRDERCPSCRLTIAMLAEIKLNDSVLDVGAGPGSPLTQAIAHRLGVDRSPSTGRLTLLDAHAPYLRAPWPVDVVRIAGEALATLPLLTDGAFSVAIAVDMPEHLTIKGVSRLLYEMRRVAHKVVWFVPLGTHRQNVDVFGMGADHWQTHRSRWEVVDGIVNASDYDDGESAIILAKKPDRVVVFDDFHEIDHPDAPGAALLIWG